jgi:hypothetical protein
MAAGGDTAADVARKLGIPIALVLAAAGDAFTVARTDVRPPRESYVFAERVRLALATGESIDRIAERLGVDRAKVRAAMRDFRRAGLHEQRPMRSVIR